VRRVPDVLIFADTVRSAELRHEVPTTVIDPMLYVERDGARHLVLPAGEIPIVEKVGDYVFHTPDDYGADELRRTSASPAEMLDEIVVRAARALGVERAIVPDSFPLLTADRLRGAGIELVPDRATFFERRRSKSAAELAGIRRAQAAAEAGMAAVRDLLRRAAAVGDGLLEVDGRSLTSAALHRAISAAFLENGASADVFVASHGAQTAIGHHLGEGQLRTGESIVVDLWPRDLESACFADMTRTFVVGEPPEELAEWHRLCREWLEVGLAAIRPGVTARSVYDAVCDQVEAAGFPTQRTKAEGAPLEEGFLYALGHGVGLEVHEEPILSLLGKAPLVVGDVLAVEPGLYRRDAYGLRIEDLVLVTADGCENLTSFPYDLAP
jgi:Xaa-Pro aminopeptidase